MQTITSIPEMRATVSAARLAGKRIGLVPTMGYLHEGHLSLIRLAREVADFVVVSIFVNPTQFGPREDLAKYPRNEAGDAARCRAERADVVFMPSAAAMYESDRSVWVEELSLSAGLCGVSRPGHFRGVATVVAKLFNIVQPDSAVFGRKDAQQLRVIERMVRDLNFPVEIVPGPTVRERDGLAMSSRNMYLSAEDRVAAAGIYEALCAAGRRCEEGERNAAELRSAAGAVLARMPRIEPEYVEVVDIESLLPVEVISAPALIAIAARVGGTRLIDNIILPDG